MSENFEGLDEINNEIDLEVQNPFEDNIKESNQNNNSQDHAKLLEEIAYLRGRIEQNTNQPQQIQPQRRSLYDESHTTILPEDEEYLNGGKGVIEKIVRKELNNYHENVATQLEDEIKKTRETSIKALQEKFYQDLRSKIPEYESLHRNNSFSNGFLMEKVPFGGGVTFDQALRNAYGRGDVDAAAEIYARFKSPEPKVSSISPGNTGNQSNFVRQSRKFDGKKINDALDRLQSKIDSASTASERYSYKKEYEKMEDRYYQELANGNIL